MSAANKMTVLFVRHAPTAWNDLGKIQGHSDIPLTPESQELYARYQVPRDVMQQFSQPPVWVSSPLRRAVDTAKLLGGVPQVDNRLAEMSWGAWEGETLAALREHYGTTMKDLEARGLDFQPPGGESPRMVIARLQDWLASMRQRPDVGMGAPVIVVAHKGVLRAMISLATGWAFVGKSPIRIDRHAVHWFEVQWTPLGDCDVEMIHANKPLTYTDHAGGVTAAAIGE